MFNGVFAMKRPMLFCLVFLIYGILISKYIPELFGAAIFFFGGFLVVLLMYFIYKYRPIFVLCLFLAIGFLSFKSSIQPKNIRIEHLAQKDSVVFVSGFVKDASISKSNRQKVIFKVKLLNYENTKISANVNVVAYLKEGQNLEIGKEAALKGKISLLDGKRNDGGFDEFNYFKSRGIHYKMFVEEAIEGNKIIILNTALVRLKNKILNIYDETLPKEEAGIIKAIMLGDKSSIDENIAETFRIAGVYHILAISGLHVAIFGLGLRRTLSLFLSKKSSEITTLLILISYCILTGGSISTIRAVAMFAISAFSKFLSKDSDLLSCAAFVCIVFLIYQPLYLWDIGFLLSFAAVFGLAFSADVMKKFSKILAPFISATFFSIPIILSFFYYFTTYSVIGNALIVPTVSVIVAFGFIVGVLGLFSINIATLFSGVLFSLLKTYEFICSFIASLPFSMILVGKPAIHTIVLWYVFGVFLVLALGSKVNKKKFYKACAVVTGLLFIASIYASNIYDAYVKKESTITMLDVSQGDCFILKSGGKTILIDSGGIYGKDIGENTGNSVIKPYLDYYGISNINAIFLSHTDYDHAFGTLELIKSNKNIEKIFLAESNVKSSLENELQKLASRKGVLIEYISAGNIIEIGDFEFECLFPPPTNQSYHYEVKTANDQSVILKAKIKGVSALFTGDSGMPQEEAMLNLGIDVSANILKLGHHGSKYSSGNEFIKAVNPQFAIVSTGKNNAYNHPNPNVVERFKEKGIKLYNTAESGSVIITIGKDGKQVTVKAMLERR